MWSQNAQSLVSSSVHCYLPDKAPHVLSLCLSLSFFLSLPLSPFRSSFGNNTVLLLSESESGLGRISDYYSAGTSGREPLVERPEARRGVVRFAPDVKYWYKAHEKEEGSYRQSNEVMRSILENIFADRKRDVFN